MTIFVCLFLFLCFLHTPDFSHASEEQTVAAELVRVVDGDTIVVNIPSYPPIFGHAIAIRLAGCDTPELRDAHPELRTLAHEAKAFVQHSLQGKQILLSNLKRGKYFRIVAHIYVDGVDISSQLIKQGLAVPYHGKAPPDHTALLSPGSAK